MPRPRSPSVWRGSSWSITSPTNAKAGSQRVTNAIVDMPARFASVDEAMAYFGADTADAGMRARFEAYLKPDGDGLAIRH